MLHWLYDPKRQIRRFAEENVKPRPKPVTDVRIMEVMEMAANNGMKQSDIDSLAEELDASKLEMPKTNKEKAEQLLYLMEILLDDLNFDSAEKDFLKEFSVNIGFPIQKAPQIIREVYNNLKIETPHSEISQLIIQMLDN